MTFIEFLASIFDKLLPDFIKRFVTLPVIVWGIATLLLIIGRAIELDPNDTLLVLSRANPVEKPHENTATLRIGESTTDKLTFAYRGCVGEADSTDALTEMRYFDENSCETLAYEGDTVWFRILLENTSATPLTNFTVQDDVRGEIPVTDECWRVDIPKPANQDPDPGWGSGEESGSLLNQGDMAVCIYSYTLPESEENPFLSTASISFQMPPLATEEDDDDEEPEPVMMSADTSTLVHIYETFPLSPEIWLPTIESSSDRVIDINAENTGIAIFWLTAGFVVIELVLNYWYHEREEKLFRALVRAAGAFVVFWSFFGHEVFWDNLLGTLFPQALERRGDIELLRPQNSVIEYAGDHLELVIISSLIIIPIGLLIGIFVTREEYREFLPLMTNIVNVGQTIPTLAVVAVMAPIIGLGFKPAIIALVLYGMLPVVRNTIAGLEDVDSFIVDSARGMGMTPAQILFQIELPIASRVIMAGIRTSMVINVGTATLGAYVVSGGLGDPIAAGLLRQVDPWVMLGAIPAALLAVILDYILGRVEFVLTPKGLQIET